MKSYTQSITVNASPQKLFHFLANPANLPKWAIFCHGISLQGTDWMVQTDFGAAKIRFDIHEKLGIIDFYISLTPNLEMPSYSRILPNETGSEYLFTHLQPSDIPDDVYVRDVVGMIDKELAAIKQLMENE
jgi:hypothetical protein